MSANTITTATEINTAAVPTTNPTSLTAEVIQTAYDAAKAAVAIAANGDIESAKDKLFGDIENITGQELLSALEFLFKQVAAIEIAHSGALGTIAAIVTKIGIL